MKKLIIKNGVLVLVSFMILLMIPFSANAQERMRQGGGKIIREKISAQQTAFITSELDLSVEEARAFWPVYDEYLLKKKNIQHAYNEKYGKWRNNLDSLPKAQQNEFADSPLDLEQKMLDLKKEYHAKFKSILPPLKVAKLYIAEREFKMMLMKKMREHRGERGDKGRGGARGQRERWDDQERGK